MADSSTERTLFAALLPPGPMHVGGLFSLTAPVPDLVVAAGIWASIVVDFLAKVSGKGHMKIDFAARFPHPSDHLLVPELLLRTLRLNCLTVSYAPFWEDLYASSWQSDSWTRAISSTPLGSVASKWTMATPLRRAASRRQALVEIDALTAVMLGITAEDLCAIYRTQFSVLRKYERVMQHDANGRQVPKDVLKEYDKHGARAELGRYELPFTRVDREAEMTIAHAEFTSRAATRAQQPDRTK
jgi:hypothetical protein